MSYQVLARKWRPSNFAQVVGQSASVGALQGALTKQRLHHAYLFTGTRGVGKTTLARILAKSLNCFKGVSATPCGQCEACIGIDQGRFVDVIEIDAASRTKVEDTRELLDNVPYAPSQGRFKIYIIDEVHMLSTHSFNALLKTLEEPPEHVKFLLATTDPQKLPITVISRCLQFHLLPMPMDVLVTHISHILTQENIVYEEQALFLVAQAAKGSVRDALSLLEQAIAYGEGKVDLAAVEVFLGVMSQETLINLLESVVEENATKVWEILESLHFKGIEPKQALDELIRLIYQLSLAKVLPKTLDNHLYKEKLALLNNKISAENLHIYYQIALLSKRDWDYAPDPQLALEMVLLRMLEFVPLVEEWPDNHLPSQSNNIADSTVKKKLVEQNNIQSSSKKAVAINQIQPEKNMIETKIFSSQEKENIAPVQSIEPELLSNENNIVVSVEASHLSPSNWMDFIEKINLAGIEGEIVKHSVLLSFEQQILELGLVSNLIGLASKSIQDSLKQSLCKYLQQDIELIIKQVDSEEYTLAKKQKQAQEEALEAMHKKVEADPGIQTMKQLFNATIQHIQPLE